MSVELRVESRPTPMLASRYRLAHILGLVVFGAACSTDPTSTAPDDVTEDVTDAELDSTDDTASDAMSAEVAVDRPTTDAAGDASRDAAPDVMSDAALDVMSDAALDVVSDRPADSAIDVAADITADVSIDRAADVTADVALDATDATLDRPVEVSLDVAVDTLIDSGADVARDATVDAPIDTPVDRGVDVVADVASDVTADVASDVIVDAGVCSAPRRLCGSPSSCVDISADAENCGACGTRCAVGNACSAGACVAITAIDAGAEHTCALLANRTVMCWGHDEFGQIGDGSIGRLTVRARPTPVAGLSDATAIAAGRSHNCAIRAGGTVSCWGGNGSGQTGSGVYTDGEARPVTVPGITGATAIAAGWSHSCAIVAGGEVRCWGSNAIGQLGNGSTVGSSLTPVVVMGVTGATAIAAGSFFTCAILSDRSVRCWGSNGNGQLGAMTATTTSRVPVTVASDLASPRRIFAGTTFACVESADDRIRCWGEGRSGQFGNGMLVATTAASAVGLTGPVSGTALGDDFACSIGASGPMCWGNNSNDQLAQGTFSPSSIMPAATVGLGSVAAFTAGSSHGCALHTDRRVTCWGGGTYGQLGNGGANGIPDPQLVSGLTGVAQVVARDHHTCVRMIDRTVRCSGRAYAGLFGDGSTVSARLTFGPVTGLTNVAQLSGGSFHTCALLLDGSIRCWGDNRDGQCGNGTTATAETPVTVTGITGVTQLTLGQTFTCALLSNGTVRCWGSNGGGTLGRGYTDSFSHSFPESPVLGLTGATSVVAGLFHTCAIRADGTVMCWGGNSEGQLGDGTTAAHYMPAAVAGLTGITKLSAGYQHTCALRNDGAVLCWGLNQSGQCGGPTTTRDILSATLVPGINDAVDVTVAEHTSCARRRDGTLWCWGNNDSWQLGNGTLFVSRPTPDMVRGLPAFTELSAGASHLCALSDGSIRCWGSFTAGEFGNGHLFPVRF